MLKDHAITQKKDDKINSNKKKKMQLYITSKKKKKKKPYQENHEAIIKIDSKLINSFVIKIRFCWKSNGAVNDNNNNKKAPYSASDSKNKLHHKEVNY